MKVIFFLSVLIISSCGRVDVPGDSGLSTLNPVKPQEIQVGSNEHTKIKAVCDAIKRKSIVLSSLVNSTYTFSGTKKSCTDGAFTNISDSNVKLVDDTSGGYKFVEGDESFFFSEVESVNQGILSLICSKIDKLILPLRVGGTETEVGANFIYVTADGINGSDCNAISNETCLMIESAIMESATTKEPMARVQSREWIRFSLMNGSRPGFFTYRKKISESGCAEGQNSGRTATLK